MTSHTEPVTPVSPSTPWNKRPRPYVSGGVMLARSSDSASDASPIWQPARPDRRSKPPSFWQPRPTLVPASASASEHTPSPPAAAPSKSEDDDVFEWDVKTDEVAAWGGYSPAATPPPSCAPALTFDSVDTPPGQSPHESRHPRWTTATHPAPERRDSSTVPPGLTPASSTSTSTSSSASSRTAVAPRPTAGANLNVKAPTFVPGQRSALSSASPVAPPAFAPASVPAPAPAPTSVESPVMGDLDLNAFIKQSASASEWLSPSPTPAPDPAFDDRPRPPSPSRDADEESIRAAASDEEYYANQWLDQAVSPSRSAVSLQTQPPARTEGPRFPLYTTTSVAVAVNGASASAEDASNGAARWKRGTGRTYGGGRGGVPTWPPRPKRVVPTAIAVSPVSSFGRTLLHAGAIQDISAVPYPHGIKSPDRALRSVRSGHGGFRYDRDFLLQFRDVCSERPASFPSVDLVWLHVLADKASPELTPPGLGTAAGASVAVAKFPTAHTDSKEDDTSSSSSSSSDAQPLSAYERTRASFSSANAIRHPQSLSVQTDLPAGSDERCGSPTSTVVGGGDAFSPRSAWGSSPDGGKTGATKCTPSAESLRLDDSPRNTRPRSIEAMIAFVESELEVLQLRIAQLRGRIEVLENE